MPLIFKRGSVLGRPKTKPYTKSVIETQVDHFILYTKSYLQKYLAPEEVRRIMWIGDRIPDLRERAHYFMKSVEKVEQEIHEVTSPFFRLNDLDMYNTHPVGVREFTMSEEFMNKGGSIYPAVLDELEEINSGKYIEAVLTGGIGSAKTTTALYTQAYQLYLLSCMRDVHATYKQDRSAEIVIIFQSINLKSARGVDFDRFRSMVDECKYFKNHFPYQKDTISMLKFPNRIEVKPVSGAETAAIGQNVIGGLIDELNYMAVVEKSKQSVDKGTFDQAVSLYNSIARRRKTRFLEGGVTPGILCLVSSKKYPGQFTDVKEKEAETDPTIYVYNKRVWEVKPEGTFNKGWFNVFIGDLARKPRILLPKESLKDEDRHLVMKIPEDFRVDFTRDIVNSLREIAGVSTIARHPYFLETDLVNASYGRVKLSIFVQEKVDFVSQKLGIRPGAFYKPELPRFAHIDLGITGDSAGLAIGCVEEFISMKELSRGTEEGMMPLFHIDGVLEVVPPRNGEILFYKIREVLIVLRKMGLNIRWVTYDSYESTDSQQLLRQQGFVTGTQSVDIVPCKPYDFLKSAIYDGRVAQPSHPHCQEEILGLERDTKTGKIDHQPGKSKDCADALAGIVYGLTMRREIWGMFRVPISQIPSSVMNTTDKLEDKNNEKMKKLIEMDEMSDMERVRARLPVRSEY